MMRTITIRGQVVKLELYGLWGYPKDFSKENGAAIQKMDAGRSSNLDPDFV